jgi:NDP-sugar pyrophosphorylase family protein
VIVLPMAGAGVRFQQAGYKTPKWALPLGDRTVFEWSLLSFSKLFEKERFLIVHREDDSVTEFVKTTATRIGVKNIDVVRLDSPTRGQAETVNNGLLKASVPPDEPITIFNIDTMRPGYEPNTRQLTSDGWLECVYAAGDHWSFIAEDFDEPGRVQKVAEKKRISDNCSTGLYYFSERHVFDDTFAEECINWQKGELFVAPLFNHAVRRGYRVLFDHISENDVFFSGTPAEYENCVLIEKTIASRFYA